MKTLTKTTYSGGIPVFQHDKAMQMAQGGFNLDITGIVAGSVIPKGTVIGVNAATRVATILKSASVTEVAGGTTTAYKVAKGHLFVVGDIITNGTQAKDITVIDTSNAAYDTITVSATLGAAAVGDAIYRAAAAGSSNPSAYTVPKGLLYKSITVATGDLPLADVVTRCTVYARRIPAVAASVRALLPNIIFSEAF